MASYSEGALYSELQGTWHIHFCSNRSCRLTYECTGLNKAKKTNCDVRRNGRCQKCRGVNRPLWVAARDPRPCCVNNVRQVTDRTELRRHRLAGPGPWYVCRSCLRPTAWPQGHPTEGKS